MTQRHPKRVRVATATEDLMLEYLRARGSIPHGTSMFNDRDECKVSANSKVPMSMLYRLVWFDPFVGLRCRSNHDLGPVNTIARKI